MTPLWVRPTERPEWGRDDMEWWWVVSDTQRVLADDEHGRTCSKPHCANQAVLVVLRDVHRWRPDSVHYTRRDFVCGEHAYGDYLIDDGRVLVKRPRPPVRVTSEAGS